MSLGNFIPILTTEASVGSESSLLPFSVAVFCNLDEKPCAHVGNGVKRVSGLTPGEGKIKKKKKREDEKYSSATAKGGKI